MIRVFFGLGIQKKKSVNVCPVNINIQMQLVKPGLEKPGLEAFNHNGVIHEGAGGC